MSKENKYREVIFDLSKRIKVIDDLIGEVPVGDQRAAGGGQQILYFAANWKPILYSKNTMQKWSDRCKYCD